MIRTASLRFVASALLTLAACGSDPATGGADTAGPPDTAEADAADVADTMGADTAQPPSTVYARRAETEADLVGGPMPFGQVGHAWIVGNAKVRFMVQGKGVSTVFHLYGGSLLGADLARPEGEPDGSVLRELFTVVDFRVVDPESIEVVADGSDGQAAIVRVTGGLAPSKIIDILDLIAGTAPVTVSVDYEVRADEPFLRMRTTIRNPTAEAVQVGGTGDFIVAGKQLDLFAPGIGFTLDGGIGGVDYLASRGDRVSYGYAVGGGAGLTAPVAENSGTFALLEPLLQVPANGEVSLERLFFVGDGSLSSVVDAMDALLEAPAGELHGVVRDPGGAPIPGVHVTALPVPASGVPKVARNQARTGADGAWSLRVPPGAYHVIASGGERRPTAPAPVTVAADGAQEVALTLAPPSTLTVEATGDGPQPASGGFPVRVMLRPLGDDVVDQRLGDAGRTSGRILAWLGPGRSTIQVAPGLYDVAISHGPEYPIVGEDGVDLSQDVTLTPTLARAVTPSGWLGCDFHQHTIGSLDAATLPEDRVRENLAEGLGCFATTEHDNVLDFAPLVTALGADDAIHSVVSDEVSVNGVGHFNAYPLPLDPADPYALTGVKLFADLGIPELFARLRALDGERVLQINHPRSDSLKGYFANLGLDPWAMTVKPDAALPEDWDALEVNADLGTALDYTPEGWQALREREPSSVPVLADWFGLLNSGRPICGVANSDCHDPGDGCGWPRTYLRAGGDPALLTDDDVVAAVKAQHAVGSRGIWLSVTVGGEERMGLGELVDGASGVALRVVAEAPPWVPVAQVELYANGLFVEARDAGPGGDDAVRLDTTFDLTPERDTWYVVVARGGGPTEPVYGGQSFAFTNPVYVDVDGGGFTAPGPVPAPETEE